MMKYFLAATVMVGIAFLVKSLVVEHAFEIDDDWFKDVWA